MQQTQKIVIEAGKENRIYWKDVWNFRGLLYFLAWRDVKVRYKQTSIGVLWALIRPGLTILILCFIRQLLSDEAKSAIPVPLLIAAGTLPWTFFATAFSDASNSLLANSNLVSKVYFPRIIVPASSIVVSLIDFAVSFGIMLGIMCFYPEYFSVKLLLLPVFLLLALITAMGAGILFASINVRYRDFRYVIPFIVQFGMYVSPVMFSSAEINASTSVPQWAKTLYPLNPMVGVIDGFRWCIFGEDLHLKWSALLISVAISVLLLIVGIFTFRKMEREFADMI